MYVCIYLTVYVAIYVYVSIYLYIDVLNQCITRTNFFLELYNYLFVLWRRQKESVQECVRLSKDRLLN
jgi:hypothetical protein